MTQEVKIGNVTVGGNNPLVLIAGPCVIENEEGCFLTASGLREIASRVGMPFIFKASYDKANRTSIHSFRGPGIKEGLRILKRIKNELKVAVLSDVHSREEVKEAAEVLDVIQIPAFLSRQTDIILEAAGSGRPINVKKGQFLSPWDVKNIIDKITSIENKGLLITERGTSFGYNNLVSDMRSLGIIRSFGYPVVFDATHSVQLPGGAGGASGGQKEFVPLLSRAAVAAGCDALFLEVHPDPDNALSDGPNMLALDKIEGLLTQVKKIDGFVREINDES